MDEPSALTRWTIFVFAGGDAGIGGAICVAAIVILKFLPRRRPSIPPLYSLIGIVTGCLFMVCSSLPLPIWLQFLTAIWLLRVVTQVDFRQAKVVEPLEQPVASMPSKYRILLALSSIAWLATLIAFELPFHFPAVPAERITKLLVIGDSVTAGLNDGDETWPIQLSHAAQLEILDASQPGATLRSARKQNERLSGANGTMILEIGGNDMLESRPVTKFEEDLDRLLSDAVQPGRTVMMFELPLPPLCAAYGLAQRRQARKHGIILIPKRLFATVLTRQGATVDGIHLSKRGQRLMMETIQRFLGARLAEGAGRFQRIERVSNAS